MVLLIMVYVVLGGILTNKIMDDSCDFVFIPTPDSIAECLLIILFLPIITFFIALSMACVSAFMCIVSPFVFLVIGISEKISENDSVQQHLEKVKSSGIYKFLFDKF